MRSARFKDVFIGLAALAVMVSLTAVGAVAAKVCDGVPFGTGWTRFDVQLPAPGNDSLNVVSLGLYGSFETNGTFAHGDLDWMYNDGSYNDLGDDFYSEVEVPQGTNTTLPGSQVIGWWSQKNGRNTYVQLSNVALADQHAELLGGTVGGAPCDLEVGDPGCGPAPVSLHIQILDENCAEIKDFCDTFTPLDTHVYNLGDLVTNTGQDITESVLQGKEGTIVITPVVACGADNRAIFFPLLEATERIIDTGNDVDYGVNLWSRGVIADPNTSEDTTGVDAQDDDDPDPAATGCEARLNDVAGFGAVDTDSDESHGAAFVLDGGSGCELRPMNDPNVNNQTTVLNFDYSTLPTAVAIRGDVVLLNFADDYGLDAVTQGYTPVAALTTYFPDIYDADENVESCPQFEVCFARLGVDDSIPESDVALPTPTPTPTPTPSPTPSGGGTESPSPSPTGGGGGGGGGSCAIGGVVGAGTAAANVALPLLLPAFAVGLGVLRRRGRKGSRR